MIWTKQDKNGDTDEVQRDLRKIKETVGKWEFTARIFWMAAGGMLLLTGTVVAVIKLILQILNNSG